MSQSLSGDTFTPKKNIITQTVQYVTVIIIIDESHRHSHLMASLNASLG